MPPPHGLSASHARTQIPYQLGVGPVPVALATQSPHDPQSSSTMQTALQ